MKKIAAILILTVMAIVFSGADYTNAGKTPEKQGMAYSFGTAGQEYGKAVCVDGNNNIALALLFQNTLDFDPGNGTKNLTARAIDCAIAKYDENMNIIWAISLEGPGIETPHGIVADKDGNFYVAGYFGSTNSQTTADFDPGRNVASIKSLGGFDAFLAKYDKNGKYLWALGLGNSKGATEERAWDLACDNEGNVIVTGCFQGTVNFNPKGSKQINVTHNGAGFGLFLAKYDKNGQNLWAFGIPSAAKASMTEAYSSVACDNENNVYFGGNYRGQCDADPGNGVLNLTSKGETDFFICKHDKNGKLSWAKSMGGAGADFLSPGALRVGKDGNVYATGHFRGTSDFDPGASTKNLTSKDQADDLFLASYSGKGDHRWSFSVPSTGGPDGGHRVDFDSSGNVVLAGWFKGSGDFDPGPKTAVLTANGASGAGDIMFAKYTKNGEYLWARLIGAKISGNDNLSIAAGLAVDSKDNIVMTGKFYGKDADFDPGADTFLLTTKGSSDCFLAKLDNTGKLVYK